MNVHVYILLDFPITYINTTVLCQSEYACLHKTVIILVFLFKNGDISRANVQRELRWTESIKTMESDSVHFQFETFKVFGTWTVEKPEILNALRCIDFILKDLFNRHTEDDLQQLLEEMIDSDDYRTFGRPFTRLVATNILINHLKANC